jgi:hypothetical protein
MAKKRNNKNNRKNSKKNVNPGRIFLPEGTKHWIGGTVMVLLSLIVAMSFFGLAGVAGKGIKASLLFLIGRTVFVVPLILLLAGFIFFNTRYKKFFYSLLLAILIIIVGISGLLESFNLGSKPGGWLGYLISLPFLKLFDSWVTEIIFVAVTFIGGLIFWHLLKQPA